MLPIIIYAKDVDIYAATRRRLPTSAGFTLGRWEIPVLVVAVIWLVFALALFRDASFKDPWIYVLIMVAIGAVYLAYLLVTRCRRGLRIAPIGSNDAGLDPPASQV